MPRRSRPSDPIKVFADLQKLVLNFEKELKSTDLRSKVLSLVPIVHAARDLGSSLLPRSEASSARDRIRLYFLKYPGVVVSGDELLVISGIGEWARRVRELRVEAGWRIVSGQVAKEMFEEGGFPIPGVNVASMKSDDYVLVDTMQDRDAAHRWHVANSVRKMRGGVKEMILEYLRQNVGNPVLGEELMYLANGRTEWARRVRELRTEQGWPIVTKTSGRPDLPVGVYLLEQDRQMPEHDRHITDLTRVKVLERDSYSCLCCGWNQDKWDRSDPRHLELHHVVEHVRGGGNDAENLVTLCSRCHDRLHASRLSWARFKSEDCHK